jgi:hypothetical protein
LWRRFVEKKTYPLYAKVKKFGGCKMPLPIPGYKEIVELLKKGATLEAQEKIMQLREAVLELQEENHKLKNTINELKEKLEISKKLEFDGSVYWLKGKGGPFCQRCYDVDQKLVRLQDDFWEDSSTWYCNECKNSYKKK